MRALLATLGFCFLAAGLPAETFDFREQGKLTIYPVGDWIIRSEDMGDIRIRIAPKDQKTNATCLIIATPGGPDEFPTPDKMAARLAVSAIVMLKTGSYVETKVNLKSFYRQTGYGYYFTYTFSDRKPVSKPPEAIKFKQVSLGVIRLSSGVVVRLEILSDGELTEPFQQLLGMVEGMELSVK